MSAEARLWVTGCGAVTALGADLPSTWTRLIAGDCGLSPVTRFDTTRSRASLAGEVLGLDPDVILPGRDRASRADAMAFLAAREALADARFDLATPGALGVVVGASTGGMAECEEGLATAARDPRSLAGSTHLRRQAAGATAKLLRDRLGAELGRTVCSACSAGSNAVVVAAGWLRAGRVDRVVAGGVDALCRLTWSGFDGLQVLSPSAARPFDARRQGITLGEGAAFLLLETEAAARARGAHPIAELRGWAVGCEGHHITQPDPEGRTVRRLMRRALDRGGLAPTDIGYIHAHGTGTPQSDRAEAGAILEVLGDGPRITSHKGQLGHTLAAAGALGAVLTVQALRTGVLPPTGGLEQPDALCPGRHVLDRGVASAVEAALVHAFGFGGLDTVLALSRPSDGLGTASTAPPAVELVITRAVAFDAGRLHVDADCASLWTSRDARDGAQTDPAVVLGHDRVRRLDQATRVLMLAVHALVDGVPRADTDLGVVAGNTWGLLDDTALWLARTFENSGRTPDPFLFPNLVPSSPVASAALFVKALGPVLAVPELELPSEAALHQAFELLRGGEAQAIAVCGHVADGPVLRAYLHMSVSEPDSREAAGGLLVETIDHARARGAPILARIVHSATATGPAGPPPSPRGLRRTAIASKEAVDLCPGWGLPLDPSAAIGRHEATGAMATAAAAALIAADQFDEILVAARSGATWSRTILVRAGGAGPGV